MKIIVFWLPSAVVGKVFGFEAGYGLQAVCVYTDQIEHTARRFSA